MTKRHLLVATDFSSRADRALRRATLLARSTGARITLVHVVDNDRPRALVDADRDAAADLLNDLVHTLQHHDQVASEASIVEGDPFAGILQAVDSLAPDLVVIGAHRRQALRDIFSGTTAERTVRACGVPILMANGVPAGPWRHVLVAMDLSPDSSALMSAVKAIGTDPETRITALHVFDDPVPAGLHRDGRVPDLTQGILAEATARAQTQLDRAVADTELAPVERRVMPATDPPATVILRALGEMEADLIVVGPRRSAGATRLFLGSVAEGILRSAPIDVLVIPPPNPG